MIDAFLSLLRTIAASLGMIAPDVAQVGALGVAAASVAVATVALAALAVIVAAAVGGRRPSPVHPARSDVLHAPVAQSDPDAPGHILRRGPSGAVLAA